MTHSDILATEVRSTHDAGTAWAQGLKAGDPFMGARPEAERQYNRKIEQTIFIYAALDVLDHCTVTTDTNGVIVSFVNRRENNSTNL